MFGTDLEVSVNKKCRTCGLEKDRSSFPATGTHVRADGVRTRLVKADCKECHNAKTMLRHQQMLEQLGVVFACERCGYDRCKSNIEFHHRDPSEKDFTVAGRPSVSMKKLKEEIDKCVVLCSICHGELHAGMWSF